MPRRSTWNVLLTAENVPRTTDKKGAAGPPAGPPPGDLAESAGLGALGDGRANQVAPLCPGTVVVADLRVTQQVMQHEPGVAGPLADAAVGDDVVARLEAQLVAVDL